MKAKIINSVNATKERMLDAARKVSLFMTTPTEKQAQMVLFTAGVIALGLAFSSDVFASGNGGIPAAANGDIEDFRIANAVSTLFTFLEGSFGALIMAASGIAAIISAAFGQYKAALSCMVCAVGAFILRSMMNTFFNTQSINFNNSY
jgi:hypothetical protein